MKFAMRNSNPQSNVASRLAIPVALEKLCTRWSCLSNSVLNSRRLVAPRSVPLPPSCERLWRGFARSGASKLPAQCPSGRPRCTVPGTRYQPPRAFWIEFEQIPQFRRIQYQAVALVYLPWNDSDPTLRVNPVTSKICREPDGQVAPKHREASGTSC